MLLPIQNDLQGILYIYVSTTVHQDQENKSVKGAERHEKGVEIQHEERRENIILSIYFHIVRAPLGI